MFSFLKECNLGEVLKITVLENQGATSTVYKIETDIGIYLLKTATKERYREWLATEADVLRKLMYTGVPVPKYISFIEEKERSHLIMSFEEGITLTNALSQASTLKEKKNLIHSFGEFLHCFHEIPTEKALEDEINWLESQLIKAEQYVKKGQTSASVELLTNLKNNRPLPTIQTMIHGDCTTDNVLVMNGKVKLFIDVAGMTIGDPRYDEALAIRSFVEDKELLATFYIGYKRYRISEEEFEYFDKGLYEFF